jgi:hypothetical protein
MEIRIERADGISARSGVFQDLLVAGRAEAACEHMHGISVVRSEQLDGGAWKPLVEQHSDHALSNERI